MGAPLAVARMGVRLAVLVLPRPEDRVRYEAELLAELHGLEPARQLRHTAGLLTRSFALRAALGASLPPTEGVPMATPTTRVPFWRCRFFRWHDWVQHSTEDGYRYHRCTRCGADRGPAGLGPMTTPPWPGGR